MTFFYFKVRLLTQNKTLVKTIGPQLDMLRISIWGIKHFEGKEGNRNEKKNPPTLVIRVLV